MFSIFRLQNFEKDHFYYTIRLTMSRSSQKPKIDNKSTIVKGFIKPTIPNFSGTKSLSDFKPNARFQSINRSRR